MVDRLRRNGTCAGTSRVRLAPLPVLRMLLLAITLLPMLALLHPAAAQNTGFTAIVINAADGNILEGVAPDEVRHPASLTKMMTLYMLFEALRDRRLTLDQLVPVSAHAASMVPTKLGLVPGTSLTVEQAILGMVTLSANDAAAAVGELLGGDEDRFAQMMTLRARALGMTNTTFRNASGLPDPDQWTTARDMALLARHLIQDFPAEYHYFSTPSFVFHGRTIYNHDNLLRTYPGADGMKTGFINGTHNLVTSALRNDVRLIGVVLGAGSNSERDIGMTAQLDRGFDAEGVPPVVMARAEHGVRLPSLIATAHADTLHPVGWRGPAPRVSARPVALRAGAVRPAPRPAVHVVHRSVANTPAPTPRPRLIQAAAELRPACAARRPGCPAIREHGHQVASR